MPAIGSIKASSILNTAGSLVTTSATVASDNTYDPEGIDPKGVARWVNRAGGIAVGYPNVSLSVRKPISGSRVYKVTLKMALPTMEVTSPTTSTGIQPAPTKAYDNMVNVEFMLPERGTAAERLSLFNQLHSLFAASIIANDGTPSDATGSPLLAAVTNFDPPY